MAPRKRASSDQLCEQAKRNVCLAKYKSIQKARYDGTVSSSRGPISPALPPTLSSGSDDNSEFEQGLSTEVDEDHIEEETTMAKEKRTKGKISKDPHTMAQTSRKTTIITLVS